MAPTTGGGSNAIRRVYWIRREMRRLSGCSHDRMWEEQSVTASGGSIQTRHGVCCLKGWEVGRRDWRRWQLWVNRTTTLLKINSIEGTKASPWTMERDALLLEYWVESYWQRIRYLDLLLASRKYTFLSIRSSRAPSIIDGMMGATPANPPPRPV